MKPYIAVTIGILILFPVFVSGADETVWKGLMFDKTTPEDVVTTVGAPKRKRKEKIKTLSAMGGKAIGKQEIQILEFEKIDTWEKVSLGFFNNKLFKVKFWPRNKTMLASTLGSTFHADFVFAEGFAKGVSLSVFEGQKEPTVPRVYPTVYFMVSAKSDRYILANINNGSMGALWKDAMKTATVQMFPGFVEDIEIISRVGEPK
jgi:hypothetical protein